MKNNSKKAFTLIELVICIAIITIFLSVVRVNFHSKDGTVAMEELNMVYETINGLKTYSISKGEEITIKFDSKKNSVKVLSKGYKFENINFKNLKIVENKDVTFNKNGIVKKGESIEFLVGDKTFLITVRPATSFVDIREKDE